MDHEAVLAFAYDDARRAERVATSVRPEVGDIDGDRTRASLEYEDDTVRVRIEASDLVALRAGINTWSTLVGVAEDVDVSTAGVDVGSTDGDGSTENADGATGPGQTDT